MRPHLSLAFALTLSCSIPAAAQAPATPARVNAQRLLQADREPNNWMTHGRTYSEQRYSPLGKITDKNVGQLGLAWFAKLDIDHGTEATPLVIDGVMYTTGARSIVYAFDARSGKLLWKFDPQVPPAMLGKGCCDMVNRGVALWQGRVFVGSFDGRLIALDARNGKKVWSVDTVIDHKRAYTVTGAPRVVRGKVIIGNGGAELGVRGYLSAYDANTGKLAWRFYTVPGDPKKPFENAAMKMAAATWTGNEWWTWGGGGTVWDSLAYDPELNLLYVGVGNGSPWNRWTRSPKGGDNLFLSSIVALNPVTGAYVWHYQTTPAESWDYTATQHMILADLSIDGRVRKVLMQAPKNGFFYVLDRANGKLISAEAFSKVTWATHVDLATGRPVENPAVADYSKEPKLTYPGPLGAHNWNPMAFHPGTGLVYIPEFEAPHVYVNRPEARYDARAGWNIGVVLLDSPEEPAMSEQLHALFKGSLLAWDPVRQKSAWRVPFPTPGNGGVLATAGNLVFQGTAGGRFVAYSADKGEKLWESDAQTGVIAGPISYAVDGEQYIAISAGWGGGYARYLGEIAERNKVSTISRMLVYKLGGTEKLPAMPAAKPVPPPPPLDATKAQIDQGRPLYTFYCSPCHGGAAVAGGSVPDLRRMNAETHEQFIGIVLGGLREPKGMPNFVNALSMEQVSAIHAYLRKRAHDLQNPPAAQAPPATK
jgi:quinohemoprotein ethanol dehydrogenase